MKTVIISIGPSNGQAYPVALYEYTSAGRIAVPSATATLPLDLIVPGIADRPLEYGGVVLKETGASPKFKELGAALFQVLSSNAMGQAWKGFRASSAELRTLLEIEAKELQLLPWELLTDETQRRLALLPAQTFARAAGYGRTNVPAVAGPIRMLVVVGTNDKTIMAEAEASGIEEALRPMSRTFDVEVLERPSKAELLDRLEKGQPHILHFIGHSGLNSNDEMVLWLDHAAGRDFWTAEEIAHYAGPNVLRIVFLNSCRSGGAASVADQSTALSIGEAFRRLGVPAVLAMQADVKGDHAARMAGRVYTVLGERKPLDVAVTLGRADVHGKMNNGLNRREWALPVLTLACEPEEVLPLPELVSDATKALRLKSCPNFLKVIPNFVNRKAERRKFFRSFYPIAPMNDFHLVIVKGPSEMGKSWISCWLMEACAWRDHHVRYVEVADDKPKDWLDVLLQIRTGDPEQQDSSPLHEPLPAARACEDFDWNLHHRLSGVTPPVRNSSVVATPVRDGRGVDAYTSSNTDFLTQTFADFHSVLKEAASNKPLLLVLDHFRRGAVGLDPSSMNVLIRKLFLPVARASLTPARIVLVLTEEEYFKVYRIEEAIPRALFNAIEIDGLKKSEFNSLATEFLRISNVALPAEKVRRMIDAWQLIYVDCDGWSPVQLERLYRRMQELSR